MNTLTQPTPVRVTQVEDQFEQLREVLHRIDELVSELQPAFSRVLRLPTSRPAENMPAVPEPMFVPVADDLRELTNTATGIGRKLQSILDRREV